VVWNSTANLVGKPGHNIALDLVNEFLNNEFKCKHAYKKKENQSQSSIQLLEKTVPSYFQYFVLTANLKNCHGQYTDTQVSRCSKIVGSVGKAIEEISTEVVNDYIPRSAATEGTSRDKIKKFIQEYREEHLFTDEHERHHTGFHNFEHKVVVKNPEKLHSRLQKYVKKKKIWKMKNMFTNNDLIPCNNLFDVLVLSDFRIPNSSTTVSVKR
jgi:hypothetical protein